MHVAACSMRLRLDQSDSLKDKRRVVRSLVERMRARFNVSAAETGRLESWREAEIGVAVVSNDPSHAREMIEAVIRFVESDGRAELVGVTREG